MILSTFKTARSSRWPILAILGYTMASGLSSIPARADGPKTRLQTVVQFDISEQPLGSALRQFASEAGFQISFPSELVSGRRATALRGAATAEEALRRLLKDTGLDYDVNGDMVAIHKLVAHPVGANSQHPPAMGSSAAAPEAAAYPGDDSSSATRMRLAQNSVASSDGSQQSPQKGPVELQEIVVTAEKRKERLIDTPQSVTVLSGDSLAKSGAVQLRDFADTVPGLTVTTVGAGFTQLTLRGVTAGQDVGPTVGIYVDEVPYGSSSAFSGAQYFTLDAGLFDVDHIEVLRGPQGTLYGASTMGGLIKYVSKSPDLNDFNVHLQTSVADVHEGGVNYTGSFAVNAPIVADKAAARVSTFYSRDGGYIRNVALNRDDVNRSDIYGGRVDLMLNPTEALTVRITGFGQNISRDGEGTADYSFTGVPINGDLDQHRLFAEPYDQHFRLASATLGYAFGPATLTSISSYQTANAVTISDASPLYVPLFTSVGLPFSAVGNRQTVSTDKFTQEIRLASSGTQTLEWLVGLFYTHENSRRTGQILANDSSGQRSPVDLATVAIPTLYKERAGFADLTWRITRQLDLSGGVRYSRNDQDFTQIGSGFFGLSTPTRSSSENVTTYLATTRYHFTENSTAYARFATGYRPGGPNYVTIDPTTGLPVGPATFKADRLKSYEVGYKAQLADRRFGIDVAAYDIDWNNIQVIVNSDGFSGIANARGGATVRGGELALTVRPISGLSIASAFAYQHATLDEAEPSLGGAAGERLPNVPRFTGSVNTDYEIPLGNWEPTVGGTLRYVSERRASFDDPPAPPQYVLPSYTAVDLHTGLSLARVSIQLYIRNIFDQRGQLSAFTSSGLPRPAILQPRTIGLTASARF